jgi:seryl-tRNA synthetase
MIRWDYLSKAVDAYTAREYQYIDVPWLLKPQCTELACPNGARQFETFAGNLPASGEQAFYQMLQEGLLGPGKYQTITPCFRDERELTPLTRQHFIKLELIDVDPEDFEKSLLFMMFDAKMVLQDLGLPVKEVETPEGYDLVHAETGVEVGSYGIRRTWGAACWVYGTGLAEPRFSALTR